jgi:hypothetical protein
MDLVCDARGRVSRRSDAMRFEFTEAGGWSILKIRENEEKPPRLQLSGKKVGGVCVLGGGDALVGASVGFGVAGCGDGLLRWGDVPTAWAYAEENFEGYQPGEGCADGRLRTPCAEGGYRLQHGVLPSQGSRCDRGGCFCAAGCCGGFCAAFCGTGAADAIFFGEFFCD